MSDDYNALKSAIAGSDVKFKDRHVQPPSLYYVTRDDKIVLSVWSPIVATEIQLSIRMMLADGTLVPRFEDKTIQPTGAGVFTMVFENAEGYLLSATVATPGAPRGQCFVSLAVKRGGGTQDKTLGDVFLQGYPSQTGAISYPTSRVVDSLEGTGRMRVVTVANPAAGTDFSVTVPAGVVWKLEGFAALYTASAVAADRLPVFEITDAVPNLITETFANAAITAGLAVRLAGFQGAFPFATATDGLLSLPVNLRLLPGWIFKSVTAGKQAADQWSAIALTVEEYIFD